MTRLGTRVSLFDLVELVYWDKLPAVGVVAAQIHPDDSWRVEYYSLGDAYQALVMMSTRLNELLDFIEEVEKYIQRGVGRLPPAVANADLAR